MGKLLNRYAAVLVIVVIALIGFYEFKLHEVKKEVYSLQAANEELAGKQMFDSFDKETGKNKNKLVNGYLTWKSGNEIANDLVKKSDGKFKKDWGVFMANEALRRDIDPYLVFELLKVESGGKFEPTLKGPETEYGHAYGMAQFMKNTAPWIAEMAGMPYEDELLFDPYYSIQLSIVYLDFLQKRFKDWDKALTAYHRGIYGMEKYIEENGHARSWYAEEIQESAEEHDFVASAR
ncbi:lytic transglycosylase domain-containing protein [Bacillus marinisedimentorum]|uniref:lytic transglycosylase domain-containing protein n=1 Tax=Bacillus marinisedimentorum TaxID=1821260 RepID=UPI001FE1D04E|nr:transglycosylase SLT domain-containing protein [Bacillus marinisedimentorum]